MPITKPRTLTALPVFNEEPHIAEILDQVRQYSSEVLVVDDGSTDGTPDVLRSVSRRSPPGPQSGWSGASGTLHRVRHERNLGYGAALRSAFDFSVAHGYDVLVTIDCDGQHEPRRIPELVAGLFPADGSRIDIVSGSRYLREFPGDSAPPEDRRRINREITGILNDRLGLNLTDAFCGFKAYRVEALKMLDITELGYGMPLQLWVQVVQAGLRIVEFPVPLIYLEEERSFGGSLDDARRRMAYYQQILERELADLVPSPRLPHASSPHPSDRGMGTRLDEG